MPRRTPHPHSVPAEPVAAVPHDAGPLTEAYRFIRDVAQPEAPIGGVLARVGDDTVVLVDIRELSQWPGWQAADAQHVLGPLDVARRADGHDAVLPWCSERVDAFLGRRRAASAPLGGGEIVTLTVSLVRGTAEVHRDRAGDAASQIGAWWLTDAGRPMFVHGEIGDTAEAAARRMVEEIAAECGDRHLHRLLVGAIGALDKPRTLASGVGALEAELFDTCAAQPLATAVFPSARACDLDTASLRPFAATDPPPETARPLREAIARHVDGDVADAVSLAVSGAVRTLRSSLGRGRRAPWVAAAGVAGAIILGGALWPTGGGGQPVAHAADPASGPSPSLSAPPTSTPAPSEASGAVADPEGEHAVAPTPGAVDEEAGALLDRLAICRSKADAPCIASVLEPSAPEPPRGAIDLERSARSVTLLDDYGGVAVLRVEALAGGAPPQLIVIVRADDGWLLRDVYDVGEQPSV